MPKENFLLIEKLQQCDTVRSLEIIFTRRESAFTAPPPPPPSSFCSPFSPLVRDHLWSCDKWMMFFMRCAWRKESTCHVGMQWGNVIPVCPQKFKKSRDCLDRHFKEYLLKHTCDMWWHLYPLPEYTSFKTFLGWEKWGTCSILLLFLEMIHRGI